MKNLAFLALCTVCGVTTSSVVHASTLTLPNETLLSTQDFSPNSTGPSFTVSGNFSPTDTISAGASGTVITYPPNGPLNAAGILTSGPSAGTFTFGAALLGNPQLGYHLLFPPTTANGLSSSAPPTDLSENIPLSQVFDDPGFTGLADGTVLEFRLNDTDNSDNSGSFSINGGGTPTPVSEPSSLLGTLVLGAFAIGSVARHQQQKSHQNNPNNIVVSQSAVASSSTVAFHASRR